MHGFSCGIRHASGPAWPDPLTRSCRSSLKVGCSPTWLLLRSVISASLSHWIDVELVNIRGTRADILIIPKCAHTCMVTDFTFTNTLDGASSLSAAGWCLKMSWALICREARPAAAENRKHRGGGEPFVLRVPSAHGRHSGAAWEQSVVVVTVREPVWRVVCSRLCDRARLSRRCCCCLKLRFRDGQTLGSTRLR